MSHLIDDRRAKRNVWILVLAQAVLGSQMPLIFTIGGLAGQSLASNLCFATLPISLIVLGSMTFATPISSFMQKYGRTAGFFLGTVGGAIGGAISAYGLLILYSAVGQQSDPVISQSLKILIGVGVMVVLSACQTNIGTLWQNDDIV